MADDVHRGGGPQAHDFCSIAFIVIRCAFHLFCDRNYSLRTIKIASFKYLGDFSRGQFGQVVENVRGSSGGLLRRKMVVVVVGARCQTRLLGGRPTAAAGAMNATSILRLWLLLCWWLFLGVDAMA